MLEIEQLALFDQCIVRLLAYAWLQLVDELLDSLNFANKGLWQRESSELELEVPDVCGPFPGDFLLLLEKVFVNHSFCVPV